MAWIKLQSDSFEYALRLFYIIQSPPLQVPSIMFKQDIFRLIFFILESRFNKRKDSEDINYLISGNSV